MNTNQDRRTSPRIAATIPVRLKTAAGETESANTRDLSTNGLFLYTNRQLTKGTELELVLILPPELMWGVRRWVCCQATVVRVEENQGQDFGIAAEIRKMDVLPEIVL
jgi:PilZ domain